MTVIPPPMTAFVLGSTEDLAFLPGGEESARTLRYTRQAEDGEPIDYWLGIPALPTTAAMCSYMANHPDGWFLTSQSHWQSWGYSGGARSRTTAKAAELQVLVEGATVPNFESRQGLAFRIQPQSEWSALT